ncbi:MAG: hypothetical protein IPK85_01610 [Gemmatimonadetes bacterium]|nr:hypothetical protein [Gemmatimonadota bacterium]
MSTRTTLAHSDEWHLFEDESWSVDRLDNPVFLELRKPHFTYNENDSGELKVRLSRELLHAIAEAVKAGRIG